MKQASAAASQAFRDLPCYCGRVLLAARAITRLYDEELRGAKIEVTQFLILWLIANFGPMTQKQLAERMAAEKTTVSRNLRLLHRRRWLVRQTGQDRRSRLVSLTASGRRQLQRAQPFWERAQQRLRAEMPQPQLQALCEVLPVAVEAALRA